MTEIDLESLSIEELEQLGYELLRQEEAIYAKRKEARQAMDRKLEESRLSQKLESAGIDATVIASVIRLKNTPKEVQK